MCHTRITHTLLDEGVREDVRFQYSQQSIAVSIALAVAGNTIRRVMAETNCHIHFPDSNRSNPNEKSNQVSIAGEEVEFCAMAFIPLSITRWYYRTGDIRGVEVARARIRELTPLIFCFDLPIIPSLQNVPDPNNPYLRAIQDQYNVQVRSCRRLFSSCRPLAAIVEYTCVSMFTSLVLGVPLLSCCLSCPRFFSD